MNFADALNVKMGEIERPPLPPLGHYYWNIKKYTFGESGDKKWETVNFQCAAFDVAPAGDVDTQALADFGGLKMVNITKSFMFSKEQTEEAKTSNGRTLYQLRQFLCEHVQSATEGDQLRKAIDSSINGKFLAPIQYREDKRTADLPEDQKVRFAEIGRTAPIPKPGEPTVGTAPTEAPARRRAAG